MRLINVLILVILFFNSSFSYSIRSVGNGGGDAEITSLIIFNNLNIINKFCSKNNIICFKDSNKINLQYSIKFSDLYKKIEAIIFLDRDLTEIEKKDKSTLYINRQNIYENIDLAKSRLDILNYMNNLLTLKIEENPLLFYSYLEVLNTNLKSIYIIKSQDNDYLFIENMSEFNLCYEIYKNNHSNCNLRYLYSNGSILIFNNLSTSKKYIVYIEIVSNTYKVIVKEYFED